MLGSKWPETDFLSQTAKQWGLKSHFQAMRNQTNKAGQNTSVLLNMPYSYAQWLNSPPGHAPAEGLPGRALFPSQCFWFSPRANSAPYFPFHRDMWFNTLKPVKFLYSENCVSNYTFMRHYVYSYVPSLAWQDSGSFCIPQATPSGNIVTRVQSSPGRLHIVLQYASLIHGYKVISSKSTPRCLAITRSPGLASLEYLYDYCAVRSGQPNNKVLPQTEVFEINIFSVVHL